MIFTKWELLLKSYGTPFWVHSKLTRKNVGQIIATRGDVELNLGTPNPRITSAVKSAALLPRSSTFSKPFRLTSLHTLFNQNTVRMLTVDPETAIES